MARCTAVSHETYSSRWAFSPTTCITSGARQSSSSVAAIAAADALIVGGTSLVVYPAEGLTRYFTGDTLAICNLAPTDQDANADLLISCDIAAAFAF